MMSYDTIQHQFPHDQSFSDNRAREAQGLALPHSQGQSP